MNTYYFAIESRICLGCLFLLYFSSLALALHSVQVFPVGPVVLKSTLNLHSLLLVLVYSCFKMPPGPYIHDYPMCNYLELPQDVRRTRPLAFKHL